MPEPYAIVLFDGECAFCDRSVKWIIDHDRAGRFRFAPRQSPVGQLLLAKRGLPPEGIESMILIADDIVSTHSTAVLRIAKRLPFPWNAAAVFLLVPRPIRDFFYRALAKRRYKIAGKMPVCSVPTPEQRGRILVELPA
ncbi:MAG TPA: DCC1-like thiol-disulfide oxidoreductase family protein [Humisphaera sp.]|jgi:predicted DCC family thiol-disulfide oxidoreductase YuxK|nr:DCC1-like thiol-disulfide oxidoreductase family protein [Humisphaera sp.]